MSTVLAVNFCGMVKSHLCMLLCQGEEKRCFAFGINNYSLKQSPNPQVAFQIVIFFALQKLLVSGSPSCLLLFFVSCAFGVIHKNKIIAKTNINEISLTFFSKSFTVPSLTFSLYFE